MKLFSTAAVTALALISSGLPAQPAAPAYKVVKSVPIGAPDGWDFVHFDPAQNRVYVAHENEIAVVDGSSGKVLGRVSGIAGAHDVAIVPALGRGYADNGESGDVTVFDLKTLAAIGKIPADKDSDAMIYDPSTGLLVVANGDAADASIIDPATGARLANVPLGGSPEMMAPDGTGKVYVNVASTNEIVRLDLKAQKIDARWPTPGCEGPHGLAFDPSNHRLFASCRNARMLVVNASDGKVLAMLPIGLGTDSAAFDPARKLAFSANKDGTLSVIAEDGPAKFASRGNVPTAPAARNMALDPSTGRIFLVTASVAATHPPTRPGAAPDYEFVPGSAELLIFAPTR